MGYFDQNGNYVEDETDLGYDPYDTGYDTGMDDYGVAGQYYTAQQLAMQNALLGQGQPSFDTAGLDPTMGATFGMQQLPQLDTKGRAQPYDLGYAAQLMNFGQDMGSSVGNNVMAYMSGPGAYAPGALDPVYDETPMAATQQYQLQAMAQSGGIQGTIADLIMGGMNAGKATARVKAMLKNPEKYADVITPEEAADMRSELDTIPADPMNGIEEQPDFNSIGKIADSIYKPFLAEQGMLNQPNIRMNADGQYVQVAQRDSPQMEWLKKMGLPDPRASYDVKYALENDPSLVGMLGQVAATQGDRDLMRKEFEDRLKRMKKYREDDIKDARTMDKYRGATQQALSEYFGAASRGQALRPEMPEGVNQWRAPSPNVLATQQANQRISPTGMDLARQQATINSRLPGMSPGARADMRDPNQPYHPAAAMDMLLGPPRPRQPEQPGQPPVNNLPSYINGSSAWTGEAQPTAGPNPGAFSQAGDIVRDAVMGAANPNDVELSLPGKPRTSEMINGIRPEGYSMLDLVRQQPFRDMANYQKQRTVDQAISPQAAAQIYMKKERDIDKRQSSAAFKYLMGLAPTIVAGRQGRSPRTDAIQQRLAPLYQIGALGQR